MDSSPTVDEIRELAALHPSCNIAPVVKEVLGDLETPVSAFLKVRRGDHSFLLESVTGGENRGRYSFIGTEPIDVLQSANDSVTDPLLALEVAMRDFKPVDVPALGLPPLSGGAVGFVGYDAVRFFEPRVAPFIEAQANPLDVPVSLWMLVDTVLMFDHVRHVMKVVSHCRLDSGDLDAAYAKAVARIDEIVARLSVPLAAEQRGLQGPIPKPDRAGPAVDLDAASNAGRSGYEGFVTALKKDIIAGNIIQAVPSHRVKLPLEKGVSAFDLYRHLRMVNPSPYMFFVEAGERTQIVGASPEMLVKVDGNRRVHTHPIAGTRRRGRDPAEDDALALELLADEKERAEHIMLVDLGRNDVGRVSKPGSVSVDALMVIEKYSHVQHIVSKVSGLLDDDKTVYDAFRAIFPAGTVSGAPKISAMGLVAKLEPERRYMYAGAVGYVSFSGVMDTAIAIRTMLVHDGAVYGQAGGGITFDSEPGAEYEETVNKLMSVVKAVTLASQMKLAAAKPTGSHAKKAVAVKAGAKRAAKHVPEATRASKRSKK